MRERKRANAMFFLGLVKKKRDVLLASCSQLLRLKSIKKNYIRIFQYGSRTGGCPTIRYQQVSWLTHPPALERGMIRFIGNPSQKKQNLGFGLFKIAIGGRVCLPLQNEKPKGGPSIGLVFHVEIKLCVDTSHSALVSNVFGKKDGRWSKSRYVTRKKKSSGNFLFDAVIINSKSRQKEKRN